MQSRPRTLLENSWPAYGADAGKLLKRTPAGALDCSGAPGEAVSSAVHLRDFCRAPFSLNSLLRLSLRSSSARPSRNGAAGGHTACCGAGRYRASPLHLHPSPPLRHSRLVSPLNPGQRSLLERISRGEASLAVMACCLTGRFERCSAQCKPPRCRRWRPLFGRLRCDSQCA